MNNDYRMKIKEHQLDPNILWKEKKNVDPSLLSANNASISKWDILPNLAVAAIVDGLSLDKLEGLGGEGGGEAS